MRARTEKAKDERRQAFLDAALDEFFEKGFAAARMDDIARRTGLSKGALYLYFDSKDALFMGLIDAIAVPRIEQIEAVAMAAPTATDAIRQMMRYVPSLVRESRVPLIVKVLIGDGGRFPDVARAYRRRVVERVLGVIAAVLERGQAAGEFTIVDPHLTARLVIAPMVLSAVWRILFDAGPRPDPEAHVDLDALFALHERMLLRALAPSEGRGP